MAGFEIGQVYSKEVKEGKKYFMAINKQTLVTFTNGKFGKFTTKKRGHISENSLSVSDLCSHWAIKLNELDAYMFNFFKPDEEAMIRARKEKYEEL